MKSAIKIAILLLTFSVVFAGATKFKKYEVKQAIIEYKLSGMTSGTKTKYISDYGYREADYTKSKTSVMGMTQNTNTVLIQDGYKIIQADLQNKTGYKGENDMLKELVKQKKDIAEFGKEMLKSLKFKNTGKTETVVGKSCEIWASENGFKIWAWKNLTLKSEVSMMGQTLKEEAISIKTDVSIPAAKFEAPKNIKYSTQEEMEKQMEQMGGSSMGF